MTLSISGNSDEGRAGQDRALQAAMLRRGARKRNDGGSDAYCAFCFLRRLRQSAIIAINSELVGLPFIFDTV